MEILNPSNAIAASLRIILVLAAARLSGLCAEIDEYQVKAFFLYNLARYVEWPTQSFKSRNDPIVICILGPNPFGASLERAVDRREVDGRAFVVRQFAADDVSGACHILFVNACERKRFRSLAPSMKGAGVLTVGDSQGFAGEGGIINFKLENGKVRFEINLQAAEREHLRISSKLLSLAQIAGKDKQ